MKVHLYLDEELVADLKAAALADGRPMSNMARILLRDALDARRMAAAETLEELNELAAARRLRCVPDDPYPTPS
jgi:hypothetical protein